MHYNFFRYYEPNLGWFTSLDPIGLAGGMNLYRFEGAVQNHTDPLGLFVPALVGAAFLAALEYAATAMTGILIGLGLYKVAAGDNAEVTVGEITEVTSSSADTTCAGKCDKPKCPDEVYKKLTSEVDKAKARSSSLKKCLPEMTNGQLYERIMAFQQEYDARKLRDDTCWDGGDQGHRQQMEDKRNAIRNCQKYIR